MVFIEYINAAINTGMIYTTYIGREFGLDIPDNSKRILVALSGGADSALMLYMIAKELQQTKPIHFLSAFTVPRPDGGANYSPKIVEYINNKLNIRISTPMILGNGNVDHSTVISEAVASVLKINFYDVIYIAENTIPPTMVASLPPVRSPSKNAWKRLVLPFFDLDKSEIIDMYYQFGIEDMLTLSHSCTANTVGRCNECFNCSERVWAFNKLGKTDPGTS